MRLGLLVCDHVDPDLIPVHGDYHDMFRDLFHACTEVDLVAYDIVNGEWPQGLDECDAWMTTGSRYSVNDEVVWILELQSFTRDSLEARIPFIGVCFGHQMLAKALGGSVSRAPTGWGIGIREVKFRNVGGETSGGYVVYSHSEQIERLPDGMEILGRSEHCQSAVIRFGTTALGIQGHPEMTSAYARSLLERRRGTLIPERTAIKALPTLGLEPDATSWVALIVEFLGLGRESA